MPPPKIAPAGDKEPSFIGVPDDYVTDYRGSELISGQTQMRPDLYPVQVGPSYETDGPNTAAAMAAVADLSPEMLARLQIKLSKAGLISKSSVVQVGIFDDVTESAYKEVLGIANRYGMSDMDALAMLETRPSLKGEDLGTARLGGGGLSLPKAKPVTTTSTSKSTEHFTHQDAESAADAAFQEALGEDASPKQIKALRKALNAYARHNPSVSTTTTTRQPDGDTTSSTSTTGGISAAGAQNIAQDIARQAPNYGEVQAATVYMDALAQAFDSPVDL